MAKCKALTGSAVKGLISCAALMVEKLKSERRLNDDQGQQLQDILMRPHKHKHRKVGRKLAQDAVDQSASSPPGSPGTGLIGSTPEPKKGRRFKPQKRKGKEVADALTSFPVGANPSALEDYKVGALYSKHHATLTRYDVLETLNWDSSRSFKVKVSQRTTDKMADCNFIVLYLFIYLFIYLPSNRYKSVN